MTTSTLPDVTREEAMFLHMVLSRDRGYARARNTVPSPLIAALVGKRLVDFVRDRDGHAIVMTASGFEVAGRRVPLPRRSEPIVPPLPV